MPRLDRGIFFAGNAKDRPVKPGDEDWGEPFPALPLQLLQDGLGT